MPLTVAELRTLLLDEFCDDLIIVKDEKGNEVHGTIYVRKADKENTPGLGVLLG